jgi:serine/threonine-protein kinase
MASPGPQSRASHTLTGATIGRFRIGERLGGGGMGEVYLAEDTALKRRVAIKRVSARAEAAGDQAARIRVEAERASALNHPGVAAVYDILEHEGDVLLVMEFVPGVSLRQYLAQSPGVDQIIALVIDAAEALGAAHEREIIHGDVKPENIMVVDGRAKLLDFGMARRMHANGGETTLLDDVEAWGGTLGYMAPEVLLHESADARSDLFSLGVVLYEALGGAPPFRGATAISTTDRTLHEDPQPLLLRNPNVPEPLARVAHKLLQKPPAARYQSAAELVRDLRAFQSGEAVRAQRLRHQAGARRSRLAIGITAGAVALVAIVLFVGRNWLRRTASPPLPANIYLAVLPFTASDAADTDLAAGFGYEMQSAINRLAIGRPLQVLTASEVRASQLANVADARRVYGVNVVLEGRIERAAGQTRLSWAATDARSGLRIRKGELALSADVLQASERLRSEILRALAITTRPEDLRALALPTRNAAAYSAYLRASGLRNSERDLQRAIELYRDAAGADPHFARAQAEMGLAFDRRWQVTGARSFLEQARAACADAVKIDPAEASGHACLGALAPDADAIAELQKAVELDPTLDSAWTSLAKALTRMRRKDDVEQLYKKWVALRPDYSVSHRALGGFYTTIGRYSDGVRELSAAVALAPDSATPYFQLGGAYIWMGDYEAAIAALQHGITIRPDPRQYSNLGSAYLALARYPQAIANFEKAAQMARPAEFVPLGNLARAYYWAGRRPEAADTYKKAASFAQQAAAADPTDPAPRLMLAYYNAMLGERAGAMKYLHASVAANRDDPETWFFSAVVHHQFGERAVALRDLEHALALGYSRSDVRSAPEFAELHSDPHFQALTRAQ